MLQPSRDLQAMIEAAQSAGAGLVHRFGQLAELAVRTKNGPADLVSIADEEAERNARSILAAARPGFANLGIGQTMVTKQGAVIEYWPLADMVSIAEINDDDVFLMKDASQRGYGYA